MRIASDWDDDDDGGGHLLAAIRIHAEELAGFRRSHLFIEFQMNVSFFFFFFSFHPYFISTISFVSEKFDEAMLGSTSHSSGIGNDSRRNM